MDYNSFTVSFNARTAMRTRVNVVSELYNMPVDEPDRFNDLRRGVARAAAQMRYAMTDCGSPHCDAFESFKDLVVKRAIELGEVKGRKHKKAKPTFV